jgi:hypothetical protein
MNLIPIMILQTMLGWLLFVVFDLVRTSRVVRAQDRIRLRLRDRRLRPLSIERLCSGGYSVVTVQGVLTFPESEEQ